jgi:hypothetical protein
LPLLFERGILFVKESYSTPKPLLSWFI